MGQTKSVICSIVYYDIEIYNENDTIFKTISLFKKGTYNISLSKYEIVEDIQRQIRKEIEYYYKKYNENFNVRSKIKLQKYKII